jgi:regulator of sigma E protease
MKNNKSDVLVNSLTFLLIAAAAVIWWDAFKGIVTFVVTLGILVAIHEWGHFIAAKAVGVQVYEFALGFGPKLVTYMRRGGTDYTIRAFPLGGFVNPKGMQPDDPITPDGINGRRPAERALVYLAGPLMNAILGVVVFMLSGALFGTVDPKKILVVEVKRKEEASRMQVVSKNGQPVEGQRPGLRVGDQIMEINGKPVDRQDVVFDEINPNAGKAVTMTVRRGSDVLVLTGTPRRRHLPVSKFVTIVGVPPGTGLNVRPGDQLSQINGDYLEELAKRNETPEDAARRVLLENAGKPIKLTVWRNGDTREIVEGIAGPLDIAVRPGERYVGALGFTPYFGQGPRVSLVRSLELGRDRIVNFFLQIYAMFSQPKQLTENVGGPIAIWNVVSEVGRLPVFYYFGVLASLSLSLAVFNLLPIFVLDGGHMLLLTLEVLRRRRLEPEMQKLAALVGLAIIGVIFVLIMWKDIGRYFG